MARQKWTPPGEMRHRVRLYTPVNTESSPGSVTRTWTAASVEEWGKVEPLRTSEVDRAMTVETDVMYKVNTRYNGTASGKDKWIWDDGGTSRHLYIQGAPKDLLGLHRETECMCIERDI